MITTTKLQKRFGIIFFLSSIILILFAVVLFVPASSPAAPVITWAPSSITETVSPGEFRVVPLVFTSSENATNITVRIVPELQPFVQVNPSTFDSIVKGRTTNLTITISAPATALPATIDGVIQLRGGSVSDKTFSRPIPITINILWSVFEDSKLGLRFEYPAFGQPSQVNVRPNGEDTVVIDVQILSPSDNTFVSQFGVMLITNKNHITLTDWFQKNIDLSGALLSTGAFTPLSLSNGMMALVASGSIPDEHLLQNGPVAQIYAISPSGNTIIALTQSQINELESYGYPPEAQLSLLQTIVEKMSVP